MKHRPRFATTAAACGFMLLAVSAAKSFAATPAAPFTVGTTVLRNGLRVVLAPDSQATIAQVNVCLHGGLGAERSEASGLSQVASRLLGRPVGSANEELAGLETEDVATASPDDFCFATTVPEELLGPAFEREAARLRSIDFGAETFDAAVEDVRSQRRAAAANPVLSGVTRLYGLAFEGHAYARPLLGIERDDPRLTADAARRYLREVTAPANVVVVVCGRFDPIAALALARRSFESLPARAVRARAPAPPRRDAGRDTIRMATSAPIVLAGWRGPAPSNADAAAFEVLAHAISTGPDSRVIESLSGRTKFERVEGHLDVRQEASLLFLVAIPTRAADGAEVEKRLFETAESLAVAPLDQGVLEGARRQAEAALVMRIYPVRGRARALAFSEVADGGAAALAGKIEAVRRVTAEDVQRAAGKVVVPSQRAVVWVLPPDAQDEGGQP